MKVLKIPFEIEKSDYNKEFVSKIQEIREQVKRDEARIVNIDDI